uniref:Uncharacterized protein n=1 Tax=Strongyloides venezuelensis TaxID=75913 RepID=A0A0K0G5Y3_STRVS
MQGESRLFQKYIIFMLSFPLSMSRVDYAKIKNKHFTKRIVLAIKKKILEVKKRKNNGTTARAATDTYLISEDKNLSEAEIRNYVNQHLKTAINLKTGSWNQKANYLYKYIPAAKEYLIQHMTRIFNGTYKLSSKNVQATCVLLHKGGSKEI